MKIIKELYDIDLVVDGRALTANNLVKVDEAIRHYKSMEKTELRMKDVKSVK